MPFLSFTALRYQKDEKRLFDELQGDINNPGQDRNPPDLRNNPDASRRNWQKAAIRFYARTQDSAFQRSPTLDEYYYGALSTMSSRNTSQVLFRRQGRSREDAPLEDDRFICMVDQLWLLVIDDSKTSYESLVRYQPSTHAF